jgi:hypothetical protein
MRNHRDKSGNDMSLERMITMVVLAWLVVGLVLMGLDVW